MYYATEKQLEKLDKLAVKAGLEVQQMMELAGWHILGIFNQLKISKNSKVIVVVGKGNKGGDGLCAARHLINHNWQVTIILLSRKMSPDAIHQLKLLKKMNAKIIFYPKSKNKIKKIINNGDLLIDSLIGYHLQGAPRGLFKELIELMNQSKKKIIAYDIPSGMDATTGKCYQPCVKAYATLSLAFLKRAFKKKEAKKLCGKIFLKDISIPAILYNKIRKNSKPSFK